ncbi:MAG: selenium metabolism membrane protein YedE/FdhT [Negativicutes bacterium]|nr:selenium metabolism membrane protein YedE/FdhT [Negativicutes bacterium]
MNEMLKRYYQRIVADFWDQRGVVVALGILSALYFGSIGVVWAVTGEFTRWGAHILQWLGADVSSYSYLQIIAFTGTPLTRIDGIMIIGMFVGAFSSALFGQNFKIRVPRWPRLLQGLLGGVIAGFGTRLAMGCNLAALFTGIPQFSIHAWLFTLGTIIGTYFGVKATLSSLLKGEPKVVAVSAPMGQVENPFYYRWQPLMGLVAVAVYAVWIAQSYATWLPTNLLIATVFGFGFGFLIQKGQVCFTSAFRDLWLVGRANTTKALIWGMAVQALIAVVFIAKGVPAKAIWWAGPGALIGGILFGIGIVIAGGCETGWMYRSVEGQVQFWFVGLGNVIGATILFMAWDQGVYSTLVAPFPRIDLVKLYGVGGGLFITGVLLLIFYLWADWRQVLRRSLLAKGGNQLESGK